MVALLIMSTAAYFLADYYVTDVFAFDWYREKAQTAYKAVNFTYIRIIENIIMMACCYIHR